MEQTVQTLPPEMGKLGEIQFANPDIEKVATSLGIAGNCASDQPSNFDDDHWTRRVPNFFLVKFRDNTIENKGTPEERLVYGIGYHTDVSKFVFCDTNYFKDASGNCRKWTIKAYVIREDDLATLKRRCAVRLQFIFGEYDELVQYTAGQDPEEPRPDNETGMGMNVKLKEVFLGPPDRYNPWKSDARYVGWKRKGDLDSSANFWAIKVASWPQQKGFLKKDPLNENSLVEDVRFENNWIFTNNMAEAQRWSPKGDDSRMRGVVELEFKTREKFIGFLKECERNKHWFGELMIMRNTDEHERGGPILDFAVYSEEFVYHHNLTPVPLEEGDWEPQGTRITVGDLEADFNKYVER